MKKTSWIIISSIVLLLLSVFKIFNFAENEGIDSDSSAFQKTKEQLKEGEIVLPIVRTTLFIFKKEQRAALWITDKQQQNHFIISEKITLKNNSNGTRLYDRESIIPEGIYTLKKIKTDDFSFTINFPNDFDIAKQKADKRPALSSIITFSITGNDLQLSKNLMNKFLSYAKEATYERTTILIYPNDFKKNQLSDNCLTCPFWIEELYGSLRMYQKDY
jgi:murein L,D-transpeptidase YafK